MRLILTATLCILCGLITFTATVSSDNHRDIDSSASAGAAAFGDAFIHPAAGRHPLFNRSIACAVTEFDRDGDGVLDVDEAALGTNPNAVDTDGDKLDDGSEVGSGPQALDGDGDGLIDALESAVSDHDRDGIVDQNDPTVGPQALRGQFIPAAIPDDFSAAARLELRIVGGDVVSAVGVRFAVPGMEFLLAVDSQQIWDDVLIPLYDDGTHGDLVAGDDVWSRGNFRSAHNLQAGRLATNSVRKISITDAHGTVEHDIWQTAIFDARIGLVDADSIAAPEQIADDMQMTDHLVNIASSCGEFEIKYGIPERVGRTFYTAFYDNYDFLAFVPAVADPSTYPGWFWGVENRIENIGLPYFDYSRHYGSFGRLTGVTVINVTPDDYIGFLMNHEILHNWAVAGLESLGFGQCSHQPSAHWGFSGVGAAFLGGFNPTSLVDHGNGTYSIVSPTGYDGVFAPIEMYLSGFGPAGSVPDIPVPINVDCGSFTYPGDGRMYFEADGFNTVSIAMIQDTLGGERVPNHLDAQRDFSLVGIVVADRLLTAAEMAYYAAPFEWFGKAVGNGASPSFEEATMGAATMNTAIGEPIIRDQFMFVPVANRR